MDNYSGLESVNGNKSSWSMSTIIPYLNDDGTITHKCFFVWNEGVKKFNMDKKRVIKNCGKMLRNLKILLSS